MHHLFGGTLQSEDHGGGSICDSAKRPALEIESSTGVILRKAEVRIKIIIELQPSFGL